jgi:hypothetical protein
MLLAGMWSIHRILKCTKRLHAEMMGLVLSGFFSVSFSG